MPITTTVSKAPSTALTYITVGAIMAVLAGTSYLFFNTDGSPVLGYIRTCFLILGLVLMVIGFAVGQIGRAARNAELPPKDESGRVGVVAPANVTPAPATGTNGPPNAVAGAAGSVATPVAQTGFPTQDT